MHKHRYCNFLFSVTQCISKVEEALTKNHLEREPLPGHHLPAVDDHGQIDEEDQHQLPTAQGTDDLRQLVSLFVIIANEVISIRTVVGIHAQLIPLLLPPFLHFDVELNISCLESVLMQNTVHIARGEPYLSPCGGKKYALTEILRYVRRERGKKRKLHQVRGEGGH